MILHYARLYKAAGGVDAFLIGSEMPDLTTIRPDASTYPAVTAFKALTADVRVILGAGPKIGYAADWSEYFGHHPTYGSGDVHFHLDPVWSDANINFIGIDNYMPMRHWPPAIHDRAYLQSNITRGEGFDWFYANPATRTAQNRTPITDGAAQSRRCSDSRICAPGGTTRISTAPEVWKVARQPHGCRSPSPAGSPNWAARRLVGAPTNRMSSSTRNREKRHALLFARLTGRRDPARLSRGDLSVLGCRGK